MDSDHTVALPHYVSYSFSLPGPHFADLQNQLSGNESVWLRNGRGLIGLGSIASIKAEGSERFSTLRQGWLGWVSNTTHLYDPSAPWLEHTPGVGLTGFSAITFDPRSAQQSVIAIPELVFGHRLADPEATGFSGAQANGNEPAANVRTWVSWLLERERFQDLTGLSVQALQDGAELTASAHEILRQSALDAAQQLREQATPVEQSTGTNPVLESGWISDEHFVRSVQTGLEYLSAGTAEKLVLSRDAVVRSEHALPVAQILDRLAQRYHQCWTYSVPGPGVTRLLGSTPEMLIKSQSGYVSARLLAGTLDRVGHDQDPNYPIDNLLKDQKQRIEHQFAIDSLTQELHGMVCDLAAPAEPFLLELPNVWHLASDVSARLTDEARKSGCAIMDLVERVHPTAAVCGTPTPVAQDLIYQLEAYDRSWYAGPVGWLDHTGNGEFGIALRGGILETAQQIRLYAGCGIVTGSDAENELAETYAKLRPMLQALGLAESTTRSTLPRSR
ncbi:isochorismate synthase [Micrococcoides hystricis]|uniref:isochorismate synthase n=1 Tax=Micrococcoides hystricis TaxID=1572761 RepID=A0ABV6P8V3_9MICC